MLTNWENSKWNVNRDESGPYNGFLHNLTPCCGFEITAGDYVRIDKTKPNWVVIYKCKNCGKEVRGRELLCVEEWKCVNRTKLIEEMLDGKDSI